MDFKEKTQPVSKLSQISYLQLQLSCKRSTRMKKIQRKCKYDRH